MRTQFASADPASYGQFGLSRGGLFGGSSQATCLLGCWGRKTIEHNRNFLGKVSLRFVDVVLGFGR